MAFPPVLAPFRIRSFRFQWPADLLTSWAFEMETLILGWYVLVETGSVVFLSVFGALGYGGTLLAPMVGVVSDRIGHRAVLAGMRAIYAAVAATIAALALAGALTPISVCVLAAITGLVRPCDMGLRSALIADTMPASHLTSALGLSRATADTAKIAGALAGAGLFAAFGIAAAYVAIAGFYFAALLLTLGVARNGAKTAAPAVAADIAPSPWGDLRDGLAHIWKSPALIAIVWLAFLFNGIAYPITNGLLPYAARDIYHVDQAGLGWLLASFAFGALVGSITLSRPGTTNELPRLMVVAGIAWFGLLLIFGQTHHFAAGIAALMLAGFFQSLAMVAHTVLLIRTCDTRMRGRVVGVRMMAIYSLPFGLLAAGALIERIGFAATIALYGASGMLFVALIALRWRAFLWRPQGPEEGT